MVSTLINPVRIESWWIVNLRLLVVPWQNHQLRYQKVLRAPVFLHVRIIFSVCTFVLFVSSLARENQVLFHDVCQVVCYITAIVLIDSHMHNIIGEDFNFNVIKKWSLAFTTFRQTGVIGFLFKLLFCMTKHKTVQFEGLIKFYHYFVFNFYDIDMNFVNATINQFRLIQLIYLQC